MKQKNGGQWPYWLVSVAVLACFGWNWIISAKIGANRKKKRRIGASDAGRRVDESGAGETALELHPCFLERNSMMEEQFEKPQHLD